MREEELEERERQMVLAYIYYTSMLTRAVHEIIFFLNIIYVFILIYYLNNLVENV
jgi:hypothetical protein